MALSTHEICAKCGNVNEIFIDWNFIPQADNVFLYTCPKCKRSILSYPRTYAVDVEIPADATIAEHKPTGTVLHPLRTR
jgi:hypothetical protein